MRCSFRGKNWHLSPITKGDLPKYQTWKQDAEAVKHGDRFWVRGPMLPVDGVAADWRAKTPDQALRSTFYRLILPVLNSNDT